MTKRTAWLAIAMTLIAVAAGTVPAAAAPITAGAGGTPARGASLPASFEHLIAEATIDDNSITRPTVECRGTQPCLVESDGAVGSARLDVFALTGRGTLRYPYGDGLPAMTFAVFDAAGRQVSAVADFGCRDQAWDEGDMIVCSNTTRAWAVTIPAGGSLAPADGRHLAVTLNPASTERYPMGHDFADKNHPATTVWDTQRVVRNDPGADPVISGLSKTLGDVIGGDAITVAGTNLQGVTEVCFGPKCVPARSSQSAVDVVTPPHHGYQGGQAKGIVPDYQKGSVDVTVKLAGGRTIAAPAQYRYDALTPVGRELSYALAHWEKYDTDRYGDFNAVGGDCINFVSAVLAQWLGSDASARADWYNDFAGWVKKHPGKNPYADPYGKLNPDNKWVTPSWAYVPSFTSWLNGEKEKLGITRTDLSSDPSSWTDIKVGDLVTFTWNEDNALMASSTQGGGPGLDPGTPATTTSAGSTDLGEDHTMVVTRITNDAGEPDIQLAGHNNDRNYLSLKAIYASTPKVTGSVWHLPARA